MPSIKNTIIGRFTEKNYDDYFINCEEKKQEKNFRRSESFKLRYFGSFEQGILKYDIFIISK